MKLKRKAALSAVAVGVLSALGTAVAAPVYKIQNIEDFDFVGPGKGTLESTRNGYAQGVNSKDELVGIALGRKKLNPEDVDDEFVDADDGIAPSEAISYSVNSEIIANNYPFVASDTWVPTFESINGATAPKDSTDTNAVNSVDAQYFGINEDGVRVGNMTAAEKTLPYDGDNADQEFWFYRDYEQRAVAVKDGQKIDLAPPYTTYTNDEEKTANIGGFSGATAINKNGLVVGYAGIDISKNSKDNLDNDCLNKDDLSVPLDICIQQDQFPDSRNVRRINYQIRGYVWQINSDNSVTPESLPLGFTPKDNDNSIYTAQALGVNDDGVVVGRSFVEREGNSDRRRYDAAFWTKKDDGSYEYHWIPVPDVKDDRESIAYDINNNGIAVGSYSTFFSTQTSPVDKFFYYDTKADNAEIVTPEDFTGKVSDLRSRGRAINDEGQVVGYTETTNESSTTRPHVGFLFDMNDKTFSNINTLLTCDSIGYERASDGKWARHKVEVTDGTGKTLTYDSKISVVDATGINDDGTIVGTALIQRPAYQVDVNGNPIVDPETKKPLFVLDADGNPVTNAIPRMVVLKPATAGEEACEISDAPEEVKYERKGAAIFYGLLALIPFAFFRRRFKK
ncbi:hypothetical protein SOPP22_14555 [Shewanella sp. OPT22]|nr:hypothetical protein SOPP22_14555 [Shewanella sp. OPT22]